MLNYIWLALVVCAVVIGGWNDRLKEVTGGAFDGAKTAVTIALGLIGIMALWLGIMRPLSGSATLALLTDIVHRLGPENIVSLTAATIYGSTETTFYVVAVYFGAVGVKQTRHAIPAGLLADLTGVIASLAVCRAVLG